MINTILPIPEFYNPHNVGEIWPVPYQERAEHARQWAERYQIQPASTDTFRISLLAVDVQNSFCSPGFELFVGGQTGNGAVEDNQRLCEFIYHNLAGISHICTTLDTHHAMQIFHSIFLIDEQGRHPAPMTLISHEDILQNRWKISPQVAHYLGMSAKEGQDYLLHYTDQLARRMKYNLTIWPYHVMLGSIGHALVPAIEEAIFFHGIARFCQADFQLKGSNPLTEHYSAIGPEVIEDQHGKMIDKKNQYILNMVRHHDMLIIAGQAKSHCVAWTIEDLLQQLQTTDPELIKKVYLLEDCSSPVVIPGIVDYTLDADQAYQRFAAAGMHIVKSTDPIQTWPGIKQMN